MARISTALPRGIAEKPKSGEGRVRKSESREKSLLLKTGKTHKGWTQKEADTRTPQIRRPLGPQEMLRGAPRPQNGQETHGRNQGGGGAFHFPDAATPAAPGWAWARPVSGRPLIGPSPRLTVTILLSRCPVAVHSEDVVRDLPVLLGIHLVQHDEEKVKSGQQRVLQPDVLHGGLVLIIL